MTYTTTQTPDSINTNRKLRTHYFIDIENFNGGPVHTIDESNRCYDELSSMLGFDKTAQITIAADITTITNLHQSWNPFRILRGWGENGADLALIESMSNVILAEGDDIVVVSGDGIFTDQIDALVARGFQVHVFSEVTALNNRLKLAATTWTTFEYDSNNAKDSYAFA